MVIGLKLVHRDLENAVLEFCLYLGDINGARQADIPTKGAVAAFEVVEVILLVRAFLFEFLLAT